MGSRHLLVSDRIGRYWPQADQGGDGAIDAIGYTMQPAMWARGSAKRAALIVGALLAAGAIALAGPADARAGQSSTGKPAFQPCDRCHPVVLGSDGQPIRPLPNGMKKHQIELEVHDTLGKGDIACLACHDKPTANPGKLILPDGTLVDITGDVSRVCQRCHFEKYSDFKVGIHGRGEQKCSAAGCHDPHTPSWIYIEALPPFQGTGIEVQAVSSERVSFKPLAEPPVAPAVLTPGWLVIAAALGSLAALGALGFVIIGGRAR